jgi:hypothetical protein
MLRGPSPSSTRTNLFQFHIYCGTLHPRTRLEPLERDGSHSARDLRLSKFHWGGSERGVGGQVILRERKQSFTLNTTIAKTLERFVFAYIKNTWFIQSELIRGPSDLQYGYVSNGKQEYTNTICKTRCRCQMTDPTRPDTTQKKKRLLLPYCWPLFTCPPNRVYQSQEIGPNREQPRSDHWQTIELENGAFKKNRPM